jgi:hypothetical protein
MQLEFHHPEYDAPIITSPIQEIRDNIVRDDMARTIPLPPLELGSRPHGAHS